MALEHVAELLARVHGSRVDRREGLLPREPPLASAETKFVADEVHHVGSVCLIEHREVGTDPERAAVHAQQPVRDRVESSTPYATGLSIAGRALGAREHLAGGPA